MTAIEAWKHQIDACRQQRSKTDDVEYWNQADCWYDNWVQDNDYVEKILPHIQTYPQADAHVLEIGAGTGGFTVPLARTAAQVVAVEPSQYMRAKLLQNLRQAGLFNVQIIPGRIEDSMDAATQFAPYNLTFAAFSLYNIENIDVLIRSLLPLTQHLAILLGTGAPSPWRQELYCQFKGEARQVSPQLNLLYPVLLEMGIYANVEIIISSQNYIYSTEEKLVDWWMDHLQLEEHRRDDLDSALFPWRSMRDGQVGIFQERLMALVWIDRNKQLLSHNSK